jgi:undecaprenyl-diphosphatase
MARAHRAVYESDVTLLSLVAAPAPPHIPILHAIVLGITQGLSEFLPISSSGHLIIVPWLFRWHELTDNPDLNKTFDVALHMGTFVGAAFYFFNDLKNLAAGGLRSIRKRAVTDDDERLAWLLLLSAIPGALLGALFEGPIEDHLGKIGLIATMLIVFGVVLAIADRASGERDVKEFRVRDAVIMGAAQALALQPGVSRSGVTITAGRWLRFERDAAARISFLMSLPIIGGAGLYKGLKLAGTGLAPGTGAAFAWGMLASAITGFAAVWFVLSYVRRNSFTPFVAYRVVVGVALLVTLAAHWR